MWRTIFCLMLTACATAAPAIPALQPPATPTRLDFGPREDGARDFALTQSPNDGVFVFTRAYADGRLVLLETHYDATRGAFSLPRPVFGDKHTTEADGFFDPRSGDLLFMSKRAHAGRTADRADFDLWRVPRRAGRWGSATPIAGVNTEHSEVFPTVDRDGVLYFASDREGGRGGIDLWSYANGTAVGLGPNVNTPQSDSNPLVLPAGGRVIFYSRGRMGLGEVDLWLTELRRGQWSSPVNLGTPVNSPQGEYAPGLSADGRTLFFSRGPDIYAVDIRLVDVLTKR